MYMYLNILGVLMFSTYLLHESSLLLLSLDFLDIATK